MIEMKNEVLSALFVYYSTLPGYSPIGWRGFKLDLKPLDKKGKQNEIVRQLAPVTRQSDIRIS